MADEHHKLPQRWIELDPQTIEWIARLNESERRRLIDLSHMQESETRRLRRFLQLDDAKWEAGFRIVTRAVVISNLLGKFPRFVLGLAALLVAIDQIWTRLIPWLGGRP